VRSSRCPININLISTTFLNQNGIFLTRNADKNSGAGTGQALRTNTAIFQRFPCDFQNESLLGVHRAGFTSGNIEELRIKLIDVLYKASLPIRIYKISLHRPATGGHSMNSIAS
jgi:hypothetical protein